MAVGSPEYQYFRERAKAERESKATRIFKEGPVTLTSNLVKSLLMMGYFVLVFFIVFLIISSSGVALGWWGAPSFFPAALTAFIGEYTVERVPSQVVETVEDVSPSFAARIEGVFNRLADIINVGYDNPEQLATESRSGSADIKNVREKNAITIGSITPSTSLYEEKKPILVYAEIIAENLNEETNAAIFCEIKDLPKKILNGEPTQPILSFQKDVKLKSQSVACNFPGGSNGATYLQGDLYKEFKLRVRYDSEADSYSKIYTVSSDYEAEAADLIKDTDFSKSSGLVKTTPAFGSVFELGFTTTKQPITEQQTSRMALHFKKRPDIQGTMKKIEKLELHVPGNIAFKNEESCDFVMTDNQDEQGNDVYTLKENVRENFNKICDPTKELIEKNLDIDYESNCIRVLQIGFSCEFNVEEVSLQPSPEFSIVRAVSKYTIEVEKTNKDVYVTKDLDGVSSEVIA